MHAPLCLVLWSTCDWYFHQQVHLGQGHVLRQLLTGVEIDYSNEFALYLILHLSMFIQTGYKTSN
jgi:hypothetical protein